MEFIPRLNLAYLPTPIQYLEDLSQEYGKNIYVKRDDFTGTELSGNKIRKLEFSLAEAVDQGADTVVTIGSLQSNHCRATAFACQLLGLDCKLVLTVPDEVDLTDFVPEGNTFLDYLTDAEVFYVSSSEERDDKVSQIQLDLRLKGKKGYFIPVGASNATGSLGYANCFREIQGQEEGMDLNFDTLALTVGSGGTYAGLWLENARQKAGKDILGISVSKSVEDFNHDISDILRDFKSKYPEASTMLDSNEPFAVENSFLLTDAYVGQGYGKTTPEEVQFIRDITRKTGIVFDPCYTGKGFRGLLEEIKAGRLAEAKNILFIHTGGIFGWTADMRRMLSYD